MKTREPQMLNVVQAISEKTNLLAQKYSVVQQENAVLKNKLITVTNQLEEKIQQIEALENKMRLMKLAGSVDGEQKTDVKLKINEIVREIDQCMAHLSS